MTNPDNETGPDDTVEISLTDQLLSPTEPPSAETRPPLAEEWTSDDEDFQPIEGKRSRWTTGLGVALIFMVGVLCGAVLSHVLSPAPAPPTIYVLNDAGTGPTASPTPSGGPSLPTGNR
ncbi:MAG TPA: hypothetical protein VFP34_14360 [Microlunatus sp.]|nr:hypothetical protein [Microlunatus sp.]